MRWVAEGKWEPTCHIAFIMLEEKSVLHQLWKRENTYRYGGCFSKKYKEPEYSWREVECFPDKRTCQTIIKWRYT